MAIIDTLPAVDVSVQLNNSFRCADEYPDPNPYRRERYLGGVERVARNYVESQEGTEFCIHVNVKDEPSIDPWVYNEHGLLFFLYIDGIFMGKRFCQNKDFNRGDWQFTFSSRKQPNEDRSSLVESRFKFQSIVTVDGEPTHGDFRRARDLGIIEVKVKLGKASAMTNRRRRKNLERDFREPAVDSFLIPEEALKGRPIYHGTSHGSTPRDVYLQVPIEGRVNRWHHIGKQWTDLCTEALKIEEIIPRTPSPEPMPQRRSVRFDELNTVPRFEDLHQYEIERLARERLRQLRDEKLQTPSLKKRTYDDYCDLTQNDEQPVRPYKIIKMRSGHEAIDLTGGY
ncbi:hypothetical protein CH63R_10065 [Colletotrichum higginsianum IMI 349063]|uniref:DUF7918 domain-containing protein n=1 Tax=Colletotrichum higginsianum (strain IMI 349063) TaxID=759273 RepID=A0A1B7Y1Q0_COLHI|nr:uncharacterized protein CH63R_10065 [Colletotrichum higginsianum IMI 349063]OBR05945.1 hypothetical protein CH63R_10065 [Colletotrichum higginsianum IMI 349063]